MLLNRVLVSIDRKTGAVTRTENGQVEVDDQLIGQACVGILTGLSVDECCRQVLSHVDGLDNQN